MSVGLADPRDPAFCDRSVHDVARDLLGCTLRHGGAAGRIVETESYHQVEPACHAFAGLTPRTRTLFGPPAHTYVYRSYGIHALLNVVAEEEGVGAAVLIRALEPLEGLDRMERRRGMTAVESLCSGPGKLTQALAIGLDLNGVPLADGPVRFERRPAGAREPVAVVGPRIGINRAVDLPWRFCDASSRCVSRPWPEGTRGRGGAGRRRAA